MSRPYRTTRRVRLASGLMGWRCRLQRNYGSLKEFRAYSDTHGLAARLGYASAAAAWQANPVIEGGVNPADFRKVED